MKTSALVLLAALFGCGGESTEPSADNSESQQVPASERGPRVHKTTLASWSEQHISWYVEAGSLNGESVILTSEARFNTAPDGSVIPAPATMGVWRELEGAWQRGELVDEDAVVFHKAVIVDDSVITVSGALPRQDDAYGYLKRWSLSDSGDWTSETIWRQRWSGDIQRFRDLEIGDVDGDGQDEFVVATHDAGVVAVVEADGSVTELDEKPDTFVHEIEIGDIDGDGVFEFFATPSDRNSASHSQHGEVVMYRFVDGAYERVVVESGAGTHAKEILAADIDGDGTTEFFAVFEAVVVDGTITTPVEVRQYRLNADGGFDASTVATIDDRQTRFLVAADFDNDGQKELVAAAMKTGLYFIDREESGEWSSAQFESNSSGFEHACSVADMNGDGSVELYVAADDQKQLNVYEWR